MKGDIEIYLEQSFKIVGIVILVYSIQLQQSGKWYFFPLTILAFIFYVIFPSEKIVEKMLISDKARKEKRK